MKRLVASLLIAAVAIAMIAADGISNPKYSSRSSAWIGASIQTVDKDLAEAFELPVTYGVILNSIVYEAPAEEAGLKRDDIIIAFDGKRVSDEDALRELLAEADDGDKVTFTVMRGADKMDFDITLGRKSSRADYKSARKRYRNRTNVRVSKFDHRNFREHPYLGVNLSNLSEQLGEYFGVRDGDGALITSVVDDSPADEAGLKAGDVIVEISGDVVDNTRDVQKIIAGKNIGEGITLSILRDKRTMKVTAKVSENDDSFFGFRDLSGTDMDFSGLMDLRRLQNLDFKYDFDFDFPSGRSYRFNSDELRNELNEDMKELKRDLQELERELRELKRSGR